MYSETITYYSRLWLTKMKTGAVPHLQNKPDTNVTRGRHNLKRTEKWVTQQNANRVTHDWIRYTRKALLSERSYRSWLIKRLRGYCYSCTFSWERISQQVSKWDSRISGNRNICGFPRRPAPEGNPDASVLRSHMVRTTSDKQNSRTF